MNNLVFANGDTMPSIGLGTWKASRGVVFDAVSSAIEMGYRHIDCAWIYGNEREIGRAIHNALDCGVVKREELWITSKLWNNKHEPDSVLTAVKESLVSLELDYLDLYLMHWPVAFKNDVMIARTANEYILPGELELSETWQAMETLVDQGLVRHIGVSNFSIKKLHDLLEKARIQPEVNQVELHPFLAHQSLYRFCRDHSIHLTAYAPLGSGDRNDKNPDEPSLLDNFTLLDIANLKNCTTAQVILAWLNQRNISTIPKSVNPARQKENLESVQIKLSFDEMDRINSLDQHYRYIKGNFLVIEDGPVTLKNLWDE